MFDDWMYILNTNTNLKMYFKPNCIFISDDQNLFSCQSGVYTLKIINMFQLCKVTLNFVESSKLTIKLGTNYYMGTNYFVWKF